MKFIFLLFLLIFLNVSCGSSNRTSSEWIGQHDRAIHIMDDWIRDPYIVLEDDGNYYLTGTTAQPNDPREKSEPYNTGLDNARITGHSEPSIVGYSIRLWKSPDLINWSYLGEPFTLDKGYWKDQYPEKFQSTDRADWRLWAPEVYLHKDQWIFVHTSPKPVGGGSNLAITQNESLQSELRFPMKEDMKSRHDPSLFQDDDGTWYLLWANTYIAPLKDGFAGFAEEPVKIDASNRPMGHEGATLRKIGDKYVLFGTAWSTDKMRKGSYNLYFCTADRITGPYSERRFVGRFLGHGTPFKDKQGKWWCTAFYNANVPPVDTRDIQQRDLGDNAQTINEKGTTIVPLEVTILGDGAIEIRAKDPNYRNPGPDEAQSFSKK